MHEVVFYMASVWMTVLLGVAVGRALRAQAATSRILAVDYIVLVVVALLVLYGSSRGSPYFLDAALALAALSFAGTLVVARYHEHEGPSP